MKKLLLTTALMSLVSGFTFAAVDCTKNPEACKVAVSNDEAVICLSKKDACLVLAALDCFSKRVKRSEDVEGDSDLVELADEVAALKETLTKCCDENGGCDDVDAKVCKLVK